MDTLEMIAKMAEYKVAAATEEVDPVKSVGDPADEPLPVQKSLLERATDNYSPDLLGSVVGYTSLNIDELENALSDQSTPIGELFSDFATAKLKERGLPGEVFYTNTVPRSTSYNENVSTWRNAIGLLNPFKQKTPSYNLYANKPVSGDTKDEAEALKNLFAKPIAENTIMQIQMMDENNPFFPDRLNKAMQQGDRWYGQFQRSMMRNQRDGMDPGTAVLKALEEQADNIEPFRNAQALVQTPRNNLRSLAHEYGHLNNEFDHGKILDTKIGPVYDFVRNTLTTPTVNIVNKLAPEGLLNSVDKLKDKFYRNPLGRIMWDNAGRLLGAENALPVNAILATRALSVLSPDTMETLKEKDPTGVVNFIDENPIMATVIANIPHIGMEAATTIPGTKLTYDFWKALKSKNNSFMNDHVLTDEVKDGLSNLSKISPTWEAAKFFGKNLAKTTTPILAPIIGMLAFNKVKDWMNSKDE